MRRHEKNISSDKIAGSHVLLRFRIECLLAFLFSIYLACVPTSAQARPKAVLVDEFRNNFCSDDVRGRLDNFFHEIDRTPGSLGIVVGNADSRMPGRFHKYFRAFQNHVIFRNFPRDRITFFRGPDSEGLDFQFWLVPKGETFTNAPPEFRQTPIEKATLFDASGIESARGTTVEFGEGDTSGEPCDWGLKLDQYALQLGADPNLTGYLLASSDGHRGRRKAQTALKLTATDLIKRHRIPAKRLKTVFVGNRKSNEMQLWLVPKDSEPPTFRENALP